MSRYIEADAYRAKWADIFDSAYGDSCCEMFKKSIDEQPTADVVEVVRCKDCKYLHRMVCPYGIRRTPRGNDFCSFGERREDDEVH